MLKKIIAAIIGIAAFMTTPAFAQQVTMTLTGEVDSICGAYDFQNSPIEIDFGLLSSVQVGQQTPEEFNNFTIVCNDPDGGTVTVESENGGQMFREGTSGGAANEVGYTVAATGDNGLTFFATDLTAPVTRTFSGSQDFVSGEPMTLIFRANGVAQDAPAGNEAPATSVFAGIYTDIVRVSVTAN